MDRFSFWGNNYYNNPVLTDKGVALAETKLGCKLPKLFLDLLQVQNGGYTKGFIFPMSKKTSWSFNHVPLTEMFGIVPDKTIKSGHNILETEYMIQEWGLPEKQVLLTGAGHWFITLDYRRGAIPSVRWLEIECNEDIHIADSFEEFINGLVHKDGWDN